MSDTWDKPYPKDMWDAFEQDLEEETQAYIKEVVAAIKGNTETEPVQESEYQSVLDEVYAILHEHNPYHSHQTGQFTSGGGGGRRAKGPADSGGGVAADARSVGKILDKAGIKKQQKTTHMVRQRAGHDAVPVKSMTSGYHIQAHPGGGVIVSTTIGSGSSRQREQDKIAKALTDAGATHKPYTEAGGGIHVTHLPGKGPGPVTTKVAATLGTVGRTSATVGSVNHILSLGKHEFKAVSLTHGGVKLVHTGKLTGAEARKAESDALGALMAHGGVVRRDAKTGDIHVTHFQNASSEVTGVHVARPKSKKGGGTEPKMRDPSEVRKEMLAWHDQREKDLAEASDKFRRSHATYNEHVSKWLKLKDQLGGDHPTVQAAAKHERFLGEIMERDQAHAKGLYDTRRTELMEKFIYQTPSQKFKFALGSGTKPPPERLKIWQEGFDEFRKIVGPSMDGWAQGQIDLFKNIPAAGLRKMGISRTPQVYFHRDPGDRSFNMMGAVHMSDQARHPTVVHELGHSLEYNTPAIAESRRAFYDERTRGEKLEKLSKLTGNRGYTDDELARKDEFTHAYMGKDYGTTGRDDKHSEMVSMALQSLHENPVKLAKDDPEFFDWAYSITHGNPGWRTSVRRIPVETHVEITGGAHKGKRGVVGITPSRKNEDSLHTVYLDGGHPFLIDPANMRAVT